MSGPRAAGAPEVDVTERGGGGLAARLPALALLLLALAYGFEASRITYAFASDPLGPRAFPLGLSAVLVLLAIAWAIRPGRAEPWPQGALLFEVVGLVALAFLTAWLFDRAGFLIATALFCAGVAAMFRATLVQAIATGVGQALLWWLVFAKGLRIALPTGSWFTGS